MTKQEFEVLAGCEVSFEAYSNIIEPMYMAVELPKQDFIKLLNLKALATPKVKEKNIKKMCVRDRSGYMKTPNGCWYHIEYVELVDVDIRTGKFIVKALDDEDFRKLSESGHDLNYSTDFDFDYIQCLDTKKKPVRLAA